MAFFGLYEPKTNIPKTEVIYGSFTWTNGGTVTAVTGWDKGWSVSLVGAGVARVTLSNSARYPAVPLVFLTIKPTVLADNTMIASDYTAVGAQTAGTSFDVLLVANDGTPVTAENPTVGTVTVHFQAVFKNTNV
jgi:hypothetical protein